MASKTSHSIAAAQWHPTKNGALTPANVSLGGTQQVWWVCHKNSEHEWVAAVYSRTGGNGWCHYFTPDKGVFQAPN